MPDQIYEYTPSDADAGPPKRRWTPLSIFAGFLIALLAFTITAQWRQGTDTQDFSGVRGEELAEMLKSIDATNQRLNTQIDELTVTRNDLKRNTQTSAEAEKSARKRADSLAILAGTVGATGPGIQITVTAPARAVTASVLLDAVQEMRDAGAEVIAINGVVRVVAQTWFADDDAGVRVGGRVLQPPFVMEIIGDPQTLAEAVRFRGGLADRVQSRGGTVEIQEREAISVTALADELEAKYAQRAE